MKPGGGGGGGAVFPRIDGLIPFSFGEPLGDVWRQRHFAHAVENLLKHAVIIQPDHPAAGVRGLAYGGGKLIAYDIGETGLCAAARAH